MKFWCVLAVLVVIASAYACASADTSAAIVLNQWTLVSVRTKNALGVVTFPPASGLLILRSDLAYSEALTIDGKSYTQQGTYTATENPCDAGESGTNTCTPGGTLTLTVSGIEPVSYSYTITTVNGGGPDGGLGGTMTWRSGALPDGGEIDAGPNAATEEFTFSLDSNTVLPQ